MTRGNDVAIPGDKLAPSELSVSTQLWWVKHLHFFHSFIIFCKHNATAIDSTMYLHLVCPTVLSLQPDSLT